MRYARAAVAGVLAGGVLVATALGRDGDTERAALVAVLIAVLLIPDALAAYHKARRHDGPDR